MNKDELGRWGEDLAAAHLEGTGLVVLARNWRCREGELDIIATDGLSQLIICEVKTRSGTAFGTPVEAVTLGKRRRLRRLASIYAATNFTRWVSIRFDVIGVLSEPGQLVEINHITEAF